MGGVVIQTDCMIYFFQLYGRVRELFGPWPHLVSLFTEFLSPQDCLEANVVRVANATIHTQCTGCSHLLFFGKQLAVLGVVVDLFVVPLPFYVPHSLHMWPVFVKCSFSVISVQLEERHDMENVKSFVVRLQVSH